LHPRLAACRSRSNSIGKCGWAGQSRTIEPERPVRAEHVREEAVGSSSVISGVGKPTRALTRSRQVSQGSSRRRPAGRFPAVPEGIDSTRRRTVPAGKHPDPGDRVGAFPRVDHVGGCQKDLGPLQLPVATSTALIGVRLRPGRRTAHGGPSTTRRSVTRTLCAAGPRGAGVDGGRLMGHHAATSRPAVVGRRDGGLTVGGHGRPRPASSR